jgi:hypothetical protein
MKIVWFYSRSNKKERKYDGVLSKSLLYDVFDALI